MINLSAERHAAPAGLVATLRRLHPGARDVTLGGRRVFYTDAVDGLSYSAMTATDGRQWAIMKAEPLFSEAERRLAAARARERADRDYFAALDRDFAMPLPSAWDDQSEAGKLPLMMPRVRLDLGPDDDLTMPKASDWDSPEPYVEGDLLERPRPGAAPSIAEEGDYTMPKISDWS